MILTQVLKDNGMHIVKEYEFHPTRKWRFDYAMPDYMIAIEIEGGVFTKGRHTRGKGYMGDMEKYNEATKLGWKLLRYPAHTFNKKITTIFQDIRTILENELKELER